MGIYQVDQTAVGVAKTRAIENCHPEGERLFEDPWAVAFFPWSLKWMLDIAKFKSVRDFYTKGYDKSVPGLYGGIVCRTRYIDDRLTKAIRKGMNTVVILGAGLDARPYRIAGIEGTKVFEVDRPDTLDYKKNKIAGISGSFPGHVTQVPIDFNRQTLDDVCAAAGVDLSQPAFFIWEGVTQYITEEAVTGTLNFVSKACPGSELVFTYVLKSVVDGTSTLAGVEKILKTVKKTNTPWIFGIIPSEVAAFLRENGLTLVEDVGASFFKENYLKQLGRDLEVYEVERAAHVKV